MGELLSVAAAHVESLLAYLSANKEWLFSGFGGTALAGIFAWLWSRRLPASSESAPRFPSTTQDENPGTMHRFDLADGQTVRAHIRIAYRVSDIFAYTATFGEGAEPTSPGNLLYPLVLSRARAIFDRQTFEEARRSRAETEAELKRDLSEEFSRCGVELYYVVIESLRLVPGQTSKEVRPKKEHGLSAAIPLTPQSFDIHLDNQHPGGELTMLDGQKARMRLSLVCRISNPYRAVVLQHGEHFMQGLSPFVYARTHQIVESHSLRDARRVRISLENEIREALLPEFKERGVELESVLIGELVAQT